jgi:hypothetical protein
MTPERHDPKQPGGPGAPAADPDELCEGEASDPVEQASEDSFPASDPPAWVSSEKVRDPGENS